MISTFSSQHPTLPDTLKSPNRRPAVTVIVAATAGALAIHGAEVWEWSTDNPRAALSEEDQAVGMRVDAQLHGDRHLHGITYKIAHGDHGMKQAAKFFPPEHFTLVNGHKEPTSFQHEPEFPLVTQNTTLEPTKAH
eukprot:GABV01009562.1.p2 GENE.GABV01009562.1~~GABV01009562.1.p2  ORF type:complete len:136 (-),score=28.54 GABV01009562.1:75-482(-)